MLADVENNRRALAEFKKKTNELMGTKVEAEEFLKFKRNVKFEHDKIHERLKSMNDSSDKIEEYLDNYLPIER